ncbi:MAG: hypothetical protein K8R69_10455 [Deltaproteobacteria bacterium]|nr:hypothetical protein [Deltaproteobacteria bacterium]
MEGEGKIATACDCIKKAADLLEEGSDDWQNLTLKAFRLLVLSGNYKEAEAYPKKLEKYPSWERDETVGWFYYRMTRYQEARASYQEALQKIPAAENLQCILIENALGNIELHEGEAEAAVARFRKTLGWEAKLCPEDRAKVNNNNLGLSLSLIGQHDEAIGFFTEKLATLAPEKVAERISLLNGLGFSCIRASRYEETILYLKQAVHLAEDSGALNALFSAMGNLLTALLKENRYAEGLSILQKVVSYQRRFGNRRDVAHNLLRQSTVYLMLGMGEFARECIDEGLNISQELSEGLLVGWFHLLRAYWERDFGSFQGSEEFFIKVEGQAAKEEDDELRSWAHYGLAEIAYDQGKIDKCRAHLEKVKYQGKDHEFGTRLRLLQAKVSTVPDPSPLYAELEAECLKIHYRELLWEVYQGWAQSCLKRKKKDEALGLFDKGWKIVQEICAVLPEEYQGRYRNLGGRKKLYEQREAARSPNKGGFFAKLGFG